MRKKIFSLLGIGLIIIIVVLLIVSCSKKPLKEHKNPNEYICVNENEKKGIVTKHYIKLKKNNLYSYTFNEKYKLKKKSDFEKKCYEKKMEESYVKSSKGVDFKEVVTCNNKKKTVNIKKEYVISKLSDDGKKSISNILDFQKKKAFDLEGYFKFFEKKDFYCY